MANSTRCIRNLLLFVGLLFSAASAQAIGQTDPSLSGPPLISGLPYEIIDHPNGNLAPPTYALRLDGLDGDADHDFTFTASEFPGAGLTILWDESAETITIEGTVFGGHTEDDKYVSAQLFDIEFVYTGVSDLGDKLEVLDGIGSGMGTITPTVTVGTFVEGVAISLDVKANGEGLIFRVDRGHRLNEHFQHVVTGHGWLTHGVGKRTAAQDWLFKVGPPIPEPGTALLMGLGLMGLASVRRPD